MFQSRTESHRMLIVSIVISVVVLVLAGTGTAGYFHIWTAWREKPCGAPVSVSVIDLTQSWLHLEPIMPRATRTPVLGEGLHCALGGGNIEEERKPCSAPVSGACDDCESLAGPACKI
ncbi:hypothetical protein Y1Q_0023935 [Alligator mississippiensis]|uniref:Uncharacterized protein n=1 Tax=Alligator mississippiensis TaxID=8496 RepID=A0A151NUY2_ALLMI|nr:hypothetical protein Y1Q_0023935 [Alligator mississippiensis]